MLKRDLILIYEGEFTQEVTKSVLAMAERNMDSFGEDPSVKRKVFNVMVECLQNISKHAENYEPGRYAKNNALFMIGKNESDYLLTSGNAVKQVDVADMTRKLEYINSLDAEGLKILYKEIITNKPGELSPKGGAGLGFVDMARKSGKPLGYDFENIDDTLAFFSVIITIPRKK
jgi:hypothetical protein